MNILGFKTNTVFVSKSLAQAQFRCLECQKVFISYRHLEKHTLRRHRESLLNMHGPLFTGQHEAFSANDRKLIEVTGRLENVLSLLETKAAECVDMRPSTAWVGNSPCVSPDNLSPILNGNCKNIYVLPAAVSNVRKSVSLFTLPKDRRLDPEWENFGTEDAELCRDSVEERNPKVESSDDENTIEISKKELAVGEDTNSPNSTGNVEIPKNSEIKADEVSQIPTGIRCDHIEAAGTLGPLIVDLINKLEQVSIEPKRITTSSCQTDIEKQTAMTVKDDRKSTNLRKSVSFTETPEIINGDEEYSCRSDSKSDERSDSGDANDHLPAQVNLLVENGAAEDDDQSCADSLEDEEYAGESDSANSISSGGSAPKNQISQGETGDRDDNTGIEPGRDLETSKVRLNHDWELENESNKQSLVRFPNVEQDHKIKYNLPQPGEDSLESKTVEPRVTPLWSQKPKKFAQTKQQILNLVEKCIEGLRSNSATTVKSESIESNTSEDIATTTSGEQKKADFDDRDPTNGQSEDVEIEQCDEKLECVPSEEHIKSTNMICVKNHSPHSAPGLMAPSSILCKDGGLDIDDMSGNSYEQFMKRFSSGFVEARKMIEERIDRISLARKKSADAVAGVPNLATEPVVAIERSPVDVADVRPKPLTRRRSDALVGDRSNALGLNKPEYAILLHHETSQVQNLIDTLVTDLQRWKHTKKNDISKAIRVQLEERLSSNLNFLGIHNDVKTLSENAMISASYLLDHRRSKAVKGPKSSYFDTLKTAFATEIDRIAKSRTDYPF